jgi:Mrp family chromosome partitioning ATPase
MTENSERDVQMTEEVLETEGTSEDVHDSEKQTVKPKEFIPLMDQGVTETFSERFRLLAQLIEHDAQKKDIKLIMVMGGYPGDGRTTIAANLSLSLADNGHRVILVDGDVHHPQFHEVFERRSATADPAEISRDNRIWKHNGLKLTWISEPGLYLVVPSDPGKFDPAKMRLLLQKLRESYDFVIIDSAPCLEFSDTFRYAEHAEGVVYVVRRRPQNLEAQRRVRKQLKNINVPFLGVVYNEF